jgi:HK97 family phage major capsid protein
LNYKEIAERALEQRARLVGELRAVSEDTSLTDAQRQERAERMEADIRAFETEAREAVEAGEREAEVRALSQRATQIPTQGAEQRRAADLPDLGEQFRSVARGDLASFEIDLRAADANTAITTDAANAGNTVHRQFASEVLEAMRDRSDIFRLARVITTSGGEPLEWPRKTGRPTAGKVGEGATYGKSKGSFSTWELGSQKYGVIVESTQEMLTDSALNLTSILAQDAGEAVADAVSADIVADLLASVPVWNGAGAALTADDIVKMPYSVLSGYRRKGAFYLNDATLATIRTFKTTDGQYLWQPGLQAGEPDRVNGYAVYTEPNMPVEATADGSKKVLLFGDLSRYIIRQVSGLRVVRSDEYGFDADIVAWKVTWRGDFGLSDTQALRAHGDAA